MRSSSKKPSFAAPEGEFEFPLGQWIKVDLEVVPVIGTVHLTVRYAHRRPTEPAIATLYGDGFKWPDPRPCAPVLSFIAEDARIGEDATLSPPSRCAKVYIDHMRFSTLVDR